MKKIALALLCATLTTWAGAQEEQAAPAGPAAAPPCDVVECAPCTRKVCCPEPTKVKTTRNEYDIKCVDMCYPPCPRFTLCKPKDCDECSPVECPKCGKPRVKRVLIKKIVVEEKDGYKCVPQEVPVEPTCKHRWFGRKHCEPCDDAGAEAVVPAAAPAGEKLPPPVAPLPKGEGSE